MNKSSHPFIDALLPQARPMALEQRFMFDAAAVAAVTDPQHTPEATQTDSAADVDSLARLAEPVAVSMPVEVRAADPALNNGRKEVAFVDTGVANHQTLVDGIRAGVEVVLLDASQDGLAQMALWAERNTGYDAIHVLSHGQDATLYLGSETLDKARLSNSAIQAALSKVGEALTPTGDLLLYACDVASSAGGKSFVSNLAEITKADIVASIDATGAPSYAGNWVLEYSSGLIESDTAIAANVHFLDVLGITSTNFDNTTLNDGSVSHVDYDGWTFGVTSGLVYIENSTYDYNYVGYLNDSSNDRSIIFNSQGAYSTIDGNGSSTAIATTYYFKSSDGTAFSLNSFKVSNAIENGLGSFSVAAYKNGAAVTTSEGVNLGASDSFGHITYTKDGVSNITGYWGTLNFDSSFNNIDEIRITFSPPFSPPPGSNGGPMALLEVDDIDITNLSANQAPVLSTPTTAAFTDSSAVDSFSNNIGTLLATDSDGIDSYGIIGGTTGGATTVGAVTYDVSKAGSYGTLYVNSADGSYVYVPNTSAIEARTASTSETFTVTATDRNASPGMGSATLTVDITAANDTPTNVTLSAATVNQSSGTNATVGTLSTTDADSGQTYSYSIVSVNGDATSTAFNTSSSSLRATNASTLAAGSYTVVVRTTDSGGATYDKSLTVTVNDDVAPSAPSTPDLDSASDTGTSNSDNITNATRPTFTGTAEAGATVTLYDSDGTTVLGTAIATGGVWSITPGSAMSAGVHTVRAKATDAAGNTSAASATLSITIDTTAPTITFSGLALSADTGASGSDFITQTAAQTITATLSSAPAGTDIVYGSLDNGVTWTNITNKVSGTTLSWNGVTLTGSDTLKLKVTDAAGNDGAVSGQTYVLDTTAPSVTVATAAFSADTGTSSTDFITKTAAQTISGTLSANLSSGETVDVSLDNGSTWTAAAATVGQNTWSLSGQTLTASNTLKVRVTDTAGNNGTALSQAYVLDTTAPTTTVSTVSFSADTGTSSTDFITKTAAQTISGTLSANVVAGEVVYVSLDNGSTWTAATTSVGSNSWSLAGQTLTGSNTLKIKVSDAAGNDGTVSSQAYVLDTTAPTAPSAPDMTNGTDSGTSDTDNITSNTTPIFSGTATANSTVTLYDTDGTTLLGTTTSDGSGNWSITSSTLSSGTHTITAKVTDTAGNESIASAGLTITVDTAAPSAIALSSNTLSNTASANTAVGTLSSTDATVGDTFTYALVAGTGSTDNASFAISGSSLQANNPSALSAGNYSVRVSTTDVAGNSFEQTFSITVTSNQAPAVTTPTAIALTDTSSTDTFSNQTGTLSATDADGIASYGIQGGATGGSTVVGAATYDVSKLGTYGTLYVKSSDGLYVYVPNASAINGRLANASETFTVTATDSNASAATGTATLTVNITGVNDTPTDIGLTATSVSQSGGANATVGTLSTTDADSGDTHTYTLVSGAGDTNNGLFNISGTSLRATNAASMTPGTYTVRVQTTDAANTTYAEAMTITVVDDVAPTVASVAVPSNAWYVAGQNLDFTVNFTESVTVVTTGGTPRIALTVGTTTVYATYLSGSGTSALVFRYTVQANDLDTNGIAVGTLALNGGTLVDAAGNNAVLTLNSVGSTSSVLVDAVTPSVPSTPDLDLASDSGTSNTDNITSDTTPTFTGTAEAGSTVTLYDTDGTVLGTTTATGGNWSITSSTLASGSHTITAKVTDAAGNVSSASAGLAITIDATAPSAVALSTISLADTLATSGSTLATLSATDTSGVTYSLVAGSGDTNNGRFTITGTDLKAGGSNLAAGTYDIRVRATDAAGNFTDQTFTITVTSGPSVASINRAGASALTNASSVDYTVTYSEAVTGVDVSDFVLTATGTAGGTIASISGSGTTYTVTVNTLSGDGTLRLDLNNSGTGIVNAGTQAITGGYTSGQTYTLDTTAPAAPSGLDMTAVSDSGTSNTDNITSVTTPTVTGGGAEAGATVKLFDTDGTTLLGTTTADGAGNWSITTSALNDGAHTLKAKVTDAAGNTSATSTGLTVTIDTTAPSAPGAPDLASASDSGSSSTDNITSVTTPTLTGGGVDAGATVTLYDTNGTTVLGTTSADGSGNWSITSSTLTSGAHTLTTKVTDAAGNTGAASAGLTVTIDTTAPSAPSAPDLASGSDAGTSNTDNITSVTTPTVNGSGAEAGATVKLYGTDGSTVLGTTTADSSGNWSITSSTLTSGAHTLTTKVTDAAGNTSAASAGLTITIDATAPSAPGTPDLAGGSDTGTSTDNITSVTTPTVTGGGAEAGATVKLYDTDGTTLLGTTTADGSGNWSITSNALSDGVHTLTTKVTDSAGNTSSASGGLSVTVDTTAPTAIALSANSVMDVSTGTNKPVATLSSTDTQSVSYSLVAGNGTNDAGNASFVIVGGTLQSRSQLTAGTYSIRVGATDAAGNISYQTFSITVNAGGLPSVPVVSSQPAAPVITPVRAAPVEIVRPPVSTFFTASAVNNIPMLASDPLITPVVMPLVPDMPGQGAAAGVVAVGVSPMAGTNFSGLRAMEASRDIVIERGEQASFTLPAGTFVHTDGNARVALSARLADGRPLPSFVKFNPTTGTFTVEAGPGEQAEQLQVVVNAVDDKGQTASTTVVIKLKEKARTSSVLDLQIKLGKPALAEQFRQADKPAGAMAELAALSKAFAASHQERSRA